MALQYPVFVFATLSLAVGLAWFFGGRPERAATAAILIAWAVGLVLFDWKIGRLSAGLALSDLGLMLVLGRLALTRDRWWLLAATAAQALAVASHLARLLLPDINETANLAALAVFDLLVVLALAGGVAERWLAREAPATHRSHQVPA
ncbi:hypothetical protein ACO2Q1_04935 [Brevundimonas sp. VNH65]|uniref:hypothetical protein n=1 Tax=Brevundimonas sp. VNH65 TaxID=3400917 RepID=UPI003C0AC6A0